MGRNHQPFDVDPRNPQAAFQVDDVDAKYRELSSAGVIFEKPPQRLFWGYGAELRDPDGYRINVWAERTMREKGGD